MSFHWGGRGPGHSSRRPLAAGAAPSEAPANSGLPVISGTPVVGETLSTTNGSWTGSPSSYAYQWYADDVEIGGATSSTYELTATEDGAEITVGVIATNVVGDSDEAVSAAVGPVLLLPGAIADLTATALSGTQVLLEFTPAANATSHEYRIDGGTPVTTADNTGEQTVSSLTADIEYDFEVRGVNGDGSGAWSNLATETTTVGALEDPVLTLTSTPGTNPPEFTVEAADLEVGWYYQLDFTTNGDAPDGTPDGTIEFTSGMALGAPVDWNAGPFAGGITLKWRMRYGETGSGPWSAWSNMLTDVMDAVEWSPLDLGAKLLAWWDISNAGSRTLDGSDLVQQLNDLSGNANHLVQGSSGSRPAYGATAWNSVMPGMDFADSNRHMGLTNSIAYSGTDGLSVHAAVEQDATASIRTIVSGTGGGSPQCRLDASHRLELVRSTQASIDVSTGTLATGWHLVGFDMATSVTNFHLDGIEEASSNDGAFVNPINTVGLNTGGTEPFRGVMGEIVITELLDGTETAALIAYLDAKWTP